MAWNAVEGTIHVRIDAEMRDLTRTPFTLTLDAMNASKRWLRYEEPIELRVGNEPLISDPDAPELKQLVDYVLRRLNGAAEGTVISLLIPEVALTASCLATVLTPVLCGIVSGQVRNRYFRVIDRSGRNEWDADAALRKQSASLPTKLACIWHSDGEPISELLGPVDEQTAATYDFVLNRCAAAGSATTRDLAEHEGITIQAASNRFSKAAAQGLLHRAETNSVQGGGVQYVYVAVV